MMLSRTSGKSSLSIWRNIGSKCSVVLAWMLAVVRMVRIGCSVLLSAKDWSQTTNLVAERGANVLGRIGHEIFNGWHDVVKEHLSLDEGAEARYLTCSSTPDLCFGIL